MIKTNKFFSFAGYFFIFIFILEVYNSIHKGNMQLFLWFSYFAFLIVGVGLMTKNSYLISSQLNIIFFPHLLWNIDFFYRIFFQSSLWGLTDYFFEGPLLRLENLVSFQHVLLIPIAIIALYKWGIERKDFWKFSLVQVIVIFFITIIFSNPIDNINCVFRSCSPLEIPFYSFVWIPAYCIIIFVTYFLMLKTLGRVSKKRGFKKPGKF